MESRYAGPMGKFWAPQRIFASLLFPLWIAYAHGQCQYEGQTYLAGDSWKSEDCRLNCTCETSSVFCEPLTCSDPGCDFSTGELLVFTAEEPCCPVCDRNHGNCKYQGQYFLEGTEWTSSACESCNCSSGAVSCVASNCPPLYCTEDDVPLQLRNECCPHCLPYTSTCIVDGVVYQDGERWSPNQCMVCQCEDGRHVCYISVCPSLVCAQDEMLKTLAGECCPQCVKFQCEEAGVRYQDGEFWYPDSCTSCSCTNSRVACQRKDCSFSGSCAQGEELIQKTGYCCPSCVLRESMCHLDDKIYVDGEIWKSPDCRICLCRSGQTYCQKINCPVESCQMGESMIQEPDQCCSVCRRTRMCDFNGVFYENDDIWRKDDCTICSCKDGKVTCFAERCVCDELGQPENRKCCLTCETSPCDPLCKNCLDTNHDHCTECLETRHVLHEGRCVFDCERGYFVNERKQCQLCHPTCSKCFGALPSQCFSCQKGLLLKKGYCVQDCGLDFFEENDKCVDCHPSCSQCQGPREDQCLACTLSGQLLQNGHCTDYCTGHFYIADGNCFACNSTCARCLKDGSCQFCPEELYLEHGFCVENCSPGYYVFLEAYCLPCHPKCLACYGPRANQCIFCPFGQYLLDGSCVSDCGQGYFGDQGGGVCSECHPDCHLCLAGSDEQCLSCASGYLLPYKGTSFGHCVKRCPLKYYLAEDGKCEECYESCETCFGPNDTECLSCISPLYLKSNKCVQHCSAGYFVVYGEETCYACHPTCLTCQGWGSDECLSCHSGDKLNDGRCTGSCATEEFLDSDGICKPCHPTCQVCVRHWFSNSSVCVQCKHQQYYILGEECIPECSQNFYHNSYRGCQECHSKCATCERGGSNGCASCWEGNTLSDVGTCAPKCHQGYFAKDGICEKCGPSCFSCSDHETCEQCVGTYVLQSGKCVSTCFEKQFIEPVTRKCKGCSSDCLTCIGPSSEECSSCLQGKLLQDGACVEACTEGYYEEDGECLLCDLKCRTCSASECTSCFPALLLLNGECVSDCGSGKYADLESLTCLSCPSHCTHCLSPDECDLCDVGFYVYHKMCVPDCPWRHYSDSLWRVCERNEYAPQLLINNTLIVGVGSTVPINVTVLSAIDEDTDYSNIRFIIVEKPQNGALIRKSDDGGEIILDVKHGFTMSDLLGGWIFFKHFRNVPLYGHLVLKVSDRQLDSPSIFVPIQVVSHDPPAIIQKEPLVAYSNTATVISPDSLQVSDRDNFEDVVLQPVQGPHQGILTRAGEETKITKFTASELSNHQIVYKHLDSQTRNRDAIIFRATDGYNFQFAIYSIYVIPEEVDEPAVVVNKPAYVKVGQDVQITSENLYAVDKGSDASQIHFSLQGTSSKTMGGYLSKAGVKKLKERIKKFTQYDINHNFISYHHENPEMLNGTMRFKVTSSRDPIRHFAMMDFQIHALSSNFTPLQPENSSNYGMMVVENHAVTLSSSHLPERYEGIDAKDIMYEITQELNPDEGILQHLDHPSTKLVTFTQADVASSKIVYRPPLQSVPKEQFNFHFIVRDAVSGFQLQPVQKFTISIIPMNNPASPTTFEHESTVTVDQGGSVLLRPNILSTTGHQVSIQNLEVVLTKPPSHGNLVQGIGPTSINFQEGDGDSFTAFPNNLFYEHDGSKNWKDEAVFTIMDGQHTTRNLLNIDIKPVDRDSPVIADSCSLTGSITEGEHFVIKPKHLEYTDAISEDRDITFTLIDQLKHGNLEKLIGGGRYTALKPKDTFSQKDINDSIMRYKARDDNEGKGKIVREFVNLNVTDGSGNVQPNQVFTIKIKPKIRKPPILVVLDDIQVEERGTAIFGPDVLEASDPDSQPLDLIIIVDQPPKHGYLDNSRPNPGAEIPLLGLPTYSFPYIDLLEGFINYKQDIDLVQEPTWDFFTVHVSDGNLDSLTMQINVTIKPINDESPTIFTQPLHVSRGGITKVTNSSLSVHDVDSNPGELMITLETTPVRGEILKLAKPGQRKKPGESMKRDDQFTFQDILDELIVYGHDNFQGMDNDSLRITASDGLYTDSAELVIIITDFDKESPFLQVNRGLELEAGTKAAITNALLRATDTDSDNNLLVYEITADPSSGRIILLEDGTPTSLSVSGPLKVFSQVDIDLGHLSYVHGDGEPAGVHFFKFNVKDPAGNTLLDRRFIITVKEDVLPPSVIRNAGISVREGSSAPITTDHLFVNDTDTDQEKLTFFVDTGPTLGHLELRSNKREHASQFVWADLVTQNILYVHTSEAEVYSDSFIFNLTDGKNYAIQTFYITILPVDDSLPHVTVKPLRVSEGSFKTITPFELKIIDLDTQDSLLSVTLQSLPLHGSILRGINDGRNESVTKLSVEEIYEGKISYLHDGSDSVEDNFEFTVSDGTNPQFVFVNGNNLTTENPVVFRVIILPIDDSVPILITNTGLKHLISTEGQHWNGITKVELHTADADTEPSWILYTVTQEPAFGILELVSHAGQKQTSFTQEDVNQNSLRYILIHDDLSTTEDSFTFSVQDTGRNVLRNNVFRISWSRINFALPSYKVSETVGLLKISLTRSGSTYKNSFVRCEALETGYATEAAQRGDDFELISSEVAFEGTVTQKFCTVRIHDDTIYEGLEGITLRLSSPAFALLGEPSSIRVSIDDDEDRPSIGFQENLFVVNETQNYLSVPVFRTGDTSRFTSVTCSTLDGTAKGSGPTGLETGSDFRSRFTTDLSEITFAPGVTQTTCDVKIIDDSFYEGEEEFELILSDPYSGAKLGTISRARIIINGPNDVPLVYIATSAYTFKENAGEVKLEIVRTGPDLSQSCTVLCNTAPSADTPAHPGEDFSESTTQITFETDQSFAECPIVILDDSPEDKVEGDEMFVVFLSNPVGCMLGKQSTTTITIQDEESDVPQIQFGSTIIAVRETDGKIEIPVMRSGDLTLLSSVRCITRQDTASVDEDFVERTDTDESLITFLPGETESICSLEVIDDTEFEGSEYFQLKLTPGKEFNTQNIKIGSRNSIVIEIKDQEDAAVIELENVYYVTEGPKLLSDSVKLFVGVLRSGDVRRHSKVRISTQDGSASSGTDYHAVSRQLEFKAGERRKDLEVEILYNSRRRWSLSFSVALSPDDLVNAELGNNTEATVTITYNEGSGSSILPAIPLVVSLLHYDDVEKGLKTGPSAGYPLVCVTPCDPKYPSYEATESLCEASGINSSSLFYTWEIAMPRDADGSMSRFQMITDTTFFTSAHDQVLDSIYFRRNVWVRCVVQPQDSRGIMGVPLRSKEVKISTSSGICHTPVIPGQHDLGLQSQSFVASLKYVKTANGEHQNKVHIRVEVPHQDGMLPLISTFPLYNIRHLLTQGIYRHQHACSNLHSGSGSSTNKGFLRKNGGQDTSETLGYHLPYQFDSSMRGYSTLELYRYLNLKNCTWTFDAWYHMTELVDLCGGTVTSDFKTRDSGQTYVTVQLPLYVAYVFAAMPTGWTSLEHKTELECSFFYNTVLWKTGLQTEDTLRGVLQVSRLGINRNGQLFFEFKTEAKFRGLFVLSHHTLPGIKSRVIPPDEFDAHYLLELLWSERTFDGPTQLWKATSSYNLKDYSGLYVVELIPCRVATTQMFAHFPNSSNTPCTAYSPQRFEIPLAFQQTNRPVALTYSLNTVFQLLNNEKMFYLDPFEGNGDVQHMDYKGTFSLGDMVFGKVFWSPEQDLKSAYELRINKVVICAGIDGYAPTYDPMGDTYGEGPQYGCIRSTKNIKHSFIILDRNNPDAEDKSFYDIPFEAKFLDDLLYSEVMSPGTDGFAFKVDALYKVNSGYQWYLQVMYTIGPSTRRLRRSPPTASSNNVLEDGTNSHLEITPIQSRGTESSINGTNIRAIRLDASWSSADHLSPGEQRTPIQEERDVVSGKIQPVLSITILVFLFVMILMSLRIFLQKRRYENRTRRNLRKQPLSRKRQTYYIQQPTNDVLQIGLADTRHSHPAEKTRCLRQTNDSVETDV